MIMQVSYTSKKDGGEEEKYFFYDDQVYADERQVKKALELADSSGEVEGGLVVGKEGYKLLKQVFAQVFEDAKEKLGVQDQG